MSLDATDFAINEPIPFNTKWYSYKYNGAGLRYEVGMNLQTGDLVWAIGPFPPGEWNDILIARYCVVHELLPGEMILADGGYNDGYNYFITPTGFNSPIDRMMSQARARHETVNRRFKTWGILSQKFRHDKNKHGLVFGAIVQLEQLKNRTRKSIVPNRI